MRREEESMRAGYVKVLAAQRVRVGRCHGAAGRFFRRPSAPSWRLWLECGHVGGRTAAKPPMSAKCDRCEFDLGTRGRRSRDWLKGEIPWGDWGVVKPGAGGDRRELQGGVSLFAMLNRGQGGLGGKDGVR